MGTEGNNLLKNDNNDNTRKKKRSNENAHDEDEVDEEEILASLDADDDPINGGQQHENTEQDEFIKNADPKSKLEIAQNDAMKRKEVQITRLRNEIKKLKTFISKRKQTYKRKRKDNQAPTRALSAYNIFVQDRFSKLASENEAALLSNDTSAQLKRVPPASLVASTGGEWKNLSAEEKAKYEAMADSDKRRYLKEMEDYTPPEKEGENKKRNKTGYNMFFSAYVLQLKQSSAGVPPERGSVARLVGNAWKELNSEEKQYYEREAERRNEVSGAERNDETERPKAHNSSYKAEVSPHPESASAPPPHLQQPHGWPPEHGGHFHPHHHPHGQFHLNHPHYAYPPQPPPGYYHGPPPPNYAPPQQTPGPPWNL